MKFIYNDGGREAAGYKGKAGDCVCRAIAIATEQDYQTVYDALMDSNKAYASTSRSRVAKRIASGNGRIGTTPRNGMFKQSYHPYLKSLGWTWTPTMFVGQGCKVHLADGELPMGRLIVQVTKHVVAVIDGVVHDTDDPQRATIIFENGIQRIAHRCVYGYWHKS